MPGVIKIGSNRENVGDLIFKEAAIVASKFARVKVSGWKNDNSEKGILGNGDGNAWKEQKQYSRGHYHHQCMDRKDGKTTERLIWGIFLLMKTPMSYISFSPQNFPPT